MKKIKNARDKITDNEVLRSYDKYKNYLSELQIYEEYGSASIFGKINIFKLSSLYKRSGFDVNDRKDLETRFQKFSAKVEQVKQKDPNVDLRDIRTQKGRNIVSDIIYETQNDKRIKSADLEAVSVVENFALYIALEQVDEKVKDKKRVLEEYEIKEEEFDEAEKSFRRYQQSGIIDVYDEIMQMNQGQAPSKIVHYAAGTLELRPSEAKRDLTVMQILKGNGTINNSKDKLYNVYNVSQAVIDNIMKDPGLTPEEKNKKISELELMEYQRVLKNVEEANRKQNTDRYKIARENDQKEIS